MAWDIFIQMKSLEISPPPPVGKSHFIKRLLLDKYQI